MQASLACYRQEKGILWDMCMEGHHKILRPSAARLLESMRDIGYSFESALADIVDNSISAGASRIEISNDIHHDSGPYLSVLDDGQGMSPDELTQAMQHGSRSPREVRAANDLGRFGLGMKTASFSQCRQLIVVSRKDGELSARCWDLDLVVNKDEWMLKLLSEDDIGRLPQVERIGPSGTLVLWQKLDRLDAVSEHQDEVYTAFNQIFSVARPHLAMTFHRFIAPPPGDPPQKLSMQINGAGIDAVDPFAQLSSPNSDAHEIEILRTGNGDIVVQGFTLPHHQRLSNAQLVAMELGSSLIETQGLYVYRARRLISGGSWLGMARRAELTKLLRVRVDVPTSLDSEWGIDVRKSRIRIPSAARARLRPLVERMTESARRPYTYRGARQAAAPGVPLWERVKERGTIRYQIRRDHPMIEALQQATGTRSNVDAILLAIEATLPLESLFSDVAEAPKAIRQQDIDADELQQLLASFVEAMVPGKDTLPVAVAELILATPVFSTQPSARAILAGLRRIEG
ncbi:ATP-binding protein [Xanthomonas cerealis pv. cerealis]|uniref:ATP-binding protein n=1 Tax=Xanthomonas cerealis pv. cerealis TaxID=152263 RepID=A0A514EE40_9XANT|nr:ATP-binding protein [Xanthomonas translucens]QDI04235.1 ATP-binding protein [Xanthomonas translucens pv. cerealis]